MQTVVLKNSPVSLQMPLRSVMNESVTPSVPRKMRKMLVPVRATMA